MAPWGREKRQRVKSRNHYRLFLSLKVVQAGSSDYHLFLHAALHLLFFTWLRQLCEASESGTLPPFCSMEKLKDSAKITRTLGPHELWGPVPVFQFTVDGLLLAYSMNQGHRAPSFHHLDEEGHPASGLLLSWTWRNIGIVTEERPGSL